MLTCDTAGKALQYKRDEVPHNEERQRKVVPILE